MNLAWFQSYKQHRSIWFLTTSNSVNGSLRKHLIKQTIQGTSTLLNISHPDCGSLGEFLDIQIIQMSQPNRHLWPYLIKPAPSYNADNWAVNHFLFAGFWVNAGFQIFFFEKSTQIAQHSRFPKCSVNGRTSVLPKSNSSILENSTPSNFLLIFFFLFMNLIYLYKILSLYSSFLQFIFP